MPSRNFRQSAFPINLLISMLFLASISSLLIGLYLPVISIRQEVDLLLIEFTLDEQMFSILEGIQRLFFRGHAWIAAILILFSVFFPLAKILLLTIAWAGKGLSGRLLAGINLLSKWSMLDVFVLAILIIVIKMNDFADAKAMSGLYFFIFHVLSSIFLGQWMVSSNRILRNFRSDLD